MSHLLPAGLRSNPNAFFVYHTSNCLLVLTPLTHLIVHRNFIFHERQNQAKSKKKKKFSRDLMERLYLECLSPRLDITLKKNKNPENQSILPDQPLFLLSSGKEL